MKLKKIIEEQFKYELGKVYPDIRVKAFKPVDEDTTPAKGFQTGYDAEIKTRIHGSVFLDVEEHSSRGLYILVSSAKNRQSLRNESDVVEIRIDTDGNVKVKQRVNKVNFR